MQKNQDLSVPKRYVRAGRYRPFRSDAFRTKKQDLIVTSQ